MTHHGWIQIKQLLQGLLEHLVSIACAKHGIRLVDDENEFSIRNLISVRPDSLARFAEHLGLGVGDQQRSSVD